MGLKIEERDQEHLIAIKGDQTLTGRVENITLLEDVPAADVDKKSRPKDVAQIQSELKLANEWDTLAIRQLIETKTAANRTPICLFLGNQEAHLLRVHLKAAFGPDAVQSLKSLYYMGLEVVEVDTDSFLRTAGAKRMSTVSYTHLTLPTKRIV